MAQMLINADFREAQVDSVVRPVELQPWLDVHWDVSERMPEGTKLKEAHFKYHRGNPGPREVTY
jgi:hypothetical protein